MLAINQKKQFFALGNIPLLVTSLSFAIPASIPDRMDTKNAIVPEIINAAMFLTIVLIVAFAGLYIYIY